MVTLKLWHSPGFTRNVPVELQVDVPGPIVQVKTASVRAPPQAPRRPMIVTVLVPVVPERAHERLAKVVDAWTGAATLPSAASLQVPALPRYSGETRP